MDGGIHGLLGCPCESCIVLLNSARIEQFMRTELGAKGMGMLSLASTVRNLDVNIRISLQFIATVRNRFCHASPWFLSEEEKTRFKQEVKNFSDRFQLDYWHGDAVRARMLYVRQQEAEQQAILAARRLLQEQQQQMTPAAILTGLPRPPPSAAAPPTTSGYDVPDTVSAEVKRRVKQAQIFAASQRLAVSESQREEEDDEVRQAEEGIIVEQGEWDCCCCGYRNQVEDVLCAICGDGTPSDRWKCSRCTNVNFANEQQCLVCNSSKADSQKKCDQCGTMLPRSAVRSCNACTVSPAALSSAPLQVIVEEEDEVQIVPAPSSSPKRRRMVDKAEEDDVQLDGWVLDNNASTSTIRVYRNCQSKVTFPVEWPLPMGWRLAVSTSRPNERLCFVCKGRKQATYPPKDTPEGWFLVRADQHRRTYERMGNNSSQGAERVQFETQWPLPEGWVLSLSKTRPNQLSYLKLDTGIKVLRFPSGAGV